MPAARFSAAIVTFREDPAVLARTLRSLAAAVARAREAGRLSDAHVVIVDNGSARVLPVEAWPAAEGRLEVVAGHGNVGYGRANNLALARVRSEVHLVLNPDVDLDPDALSAALAALAEHPEVGLVAPSVRGADGERQYLCRRYPSLWVLFLRGFAPAWLRRRFEPTLARYEMRDVIGDRFVDDVPIASGCFMAARTALLKAVGGFDPRFFLYFEDYDLSLRLARDGRARLAYVPEARIVHLGGGAARKGPRHVAWFVASAWRFFARHGWKLG